MLDIIREWVEPKGYRITSESLDPKLLIVGEFHFIENLIEAQCDIMRKVKPHYILHEFLGQEGKHGTNNNELLKWNLDQIRNVASEVDAQLLGCDLIGSDYTIDRELHMGKVLSNYTKLSDRPVVAVMGLYHAHPLSAIYDSIPKDMFCTVMQGFVSRSSRTSWFEERKV